MRPIATRFLISSAIVWLVLSVVSDIGHATPIVMPKDPGARPTTAPSRTSKPLCFDAKPLPGLTQAEEKLFCSGAEDFAKKNTVKEDGLGPTFNFISCRGCHVHPASGGSSPLGANPQYEFARKYLRATNDIPFFIRPNGPIMVARLKWKPDGTPDGGVHALFTIAGLEEADGCRLRQRHGDWTKEDPNNITNRIPTPTLGAGLIEQIDDATILKNLDYQGTRVFEGGVRVALGRPNMVPPFQVNGIGLTGRAKENRNGNDGTIARFGWKAQNKSLVIFAGEAYNVEMGISNEVFPTERDESKECQFHSVPNDTSHPEHLFDADPEKRLDALSDVEKLATFMRLLAPPERSSDVSSDWRSIRAGEQVFDNIGCSTCHTPTLRTSPLSASAALRNKPVNLFSDLALHKMGADLDDGISQGEARGDEFRSAPLWGLGQRVWFLHDGRTKDLVNAIEYHSSPGSDANGVIDLYRKLSDSQKQDLVNFLRSL